VPERDLPAQLQRGLQALGEDPAAHPCDAYLAYIDLLSQWNRAYSLTGIKDKGKMLSHHILDSLAVLPYIKAASCLDIGSGAGLPGLILALARPDQYWLLLDSNKKKVRFLNQAVMELKLGNVEVACIRAEHYQPDQKFSTVISRALTSLMNFRKLASPLVQKQGLILAMKGMQQEDELKELEVAGISFTLHEITVPEMTAQRHIVVINGQSTD